MPASFRETVLSEQRARRRISTDGIVWLADVLREHRGVVAAIRLRDAAAEQGFGRFAIFEEECAAFRLFVAAEEGAARGRIARIREDSLRRTALRGMIEFAGSYSRSNRALHAAHTRACHDRYTMAAQRSQQLLAAASPRRIDDRDDDSDFAGSPSPLLVSSEGTAIEDRREAEAARSPQDAAASAHRQGFALRTLSRASATRPSPKPKGPRGAPLPYSPTAATGSSPSRPPKKVLRAVAAALLGEVRVASSRGARPSTVRAFAETTMSRLRRMHSTASDSTGGYD